MNMDITGLDKKISNIPPTNHWRLIDFDQTIALPDTETRQCHLRGDCYLACEVQCVFNFTQGLSAWLLGVLTHHSLHSINFRKFLLPYWCWATRKHSRNHRTSHRDRVHNTDAPITSNSVLVAKQRIARTNFLIVHTQSCSSLGMALFGPMRDGTSER